MKKVKEQQASSMSVVGGNKPPIGGTASKMLGGMTSKRQQDALNDLDVMSDG